MEKIKLLTLLFLLFATGICPVLAQDTSYTPARFDGRVGQISIENTSAYPVQIALWHPDSKSTFGTWTITAVSTKFLAHEGKRINIGNDWGIQLGDSEVKSIGRISRWSNGTWAVSPQSFFGSGPSFETRPGLPVINSPVTRASSSLEERLAAARTRIISEVERYVAHNYAQGNKGKAQVQALQLRGGKLYLKVWLRHHHVWNVPIIGRQTMYDITNTVEVSFDPLNPDRTVDRTRICVDLPPQVGGGAVCKSAAEIARLIVALL